LGQTASGIEERTSNGLNLRHAYGWWDVTPDFQIMAGKSTTPFSPLNPSQMIGTRSGTVNIIGAGYGNFYSGRFAQVRGTWKFGKVGRLAVALVDPNGGSRIVTSFAKYFPWDAAGWDYQTNTKLPRIDIAVPLYFGPISIYPGFLWQERTVDNISGGTANPAPAAADDSVTTYIGSLGIKGGFGGFSFAAEGNWGQNWGNTRALIGTSAPTIFASAMLNSDGSTNDSTTYGYWFDLGYKFGPVNPHVIFGQLKTKADLLNTSVDTSSTVWGFSIPIDLAKGFRIRPELMWYDDGEFQIAGSDLVELGSYAIYGVQFQITF
jgi:hypothetical protein